MEPLDTFDRDILAIVQRNCQIKAEAVASIVGLSASSVQRRLKRMRDDGTIVAELAVVDRKAAGLIMMFIAGMEIEREHYDSLSKFKAWAFKHDNIQQVYYVTGTVDIVAIILARDAVHYDEIALQIMSENPQIKRITTNVVLRDVKIGTYIPVESNIA
ncbi:MULTISPECIES: Lrp/AsnC family transcriptional regulator [unclassified Mesorhizobium]|uniref:Lrp/AsnC family transcriptional regulator n=1 Tax=unclassified Mesorhizobium TaxID=325217 RepID=UPI000FE40999|nr:MULTISPECIES: Lrp/AsnC family transcriptional regulator [unclassified Mesorhizobium]RWQ13732.1 MAG: Lrp/AsnC family transcriptional regulator [Mesorhizobium sp.]TGQ37808.1 Lrp/AsnC family transcriptional regulator [Mesorhizobium sp. M4B.F.Ca.ET.214.01.1.1]TGQ59575.1 Lrp/AsnC family transcriptional regulator [Mesorhizobium sp. M4B.F.Ca.ET.211.01.1.1]TGU34641.1 Lrp/AsnC family transcriptional regulator [Mesorhizobium sp. M4B.F.Ca.ET.150.01.1.1]